MGRKIQSCRLGTASSGLYPLPVGQNKYRPVIDNFERAALRGIGNNNLICSAILDKYLINFLLAFSLVDIQSQVFAKINKHLILNKHFWDRGSNFKLCLLEDAERIWQKDE